MSSQCAQADQFGSESGGGSRDGAESEEVKGVTGEMLSRDQL
jgi:hypothetical protein